MLRFILAALSALSIATSFALSADADAFDPDRRVVFTAEQVAAQAAAAKRPWKVPGGWTPTADDIERTEALLAPALAAEIAKHVRDEDRPLLLVDYHRQYFGLTKGDQRLVVVNGFHRTFVENETDRAPDFWKRELTGAFDGGCLFFHAVFDPAAQKAESVVCQRNPLRESEDEQRGQPH